MEDTGGGGGTDGVDAIGGAGGAGGGVTVGCGGTDGPGDGAAEYGCGGTTGVGAGWGGAGGGGGAGDGAGYVRVGGVGVSCSNTRVGGKSDWRDRVGGSSDSDEGVTGAGVVGVGSVWGSGIVGGSVGVGTGIGSTSAHGSTGGRSSGAGWRLPSGGAPGASAGVAPAEAVGVSVESGAIVLSVPGDVSSGRPDGVGCSAEGRSSAECGCGMLMFSSRDRIDPSTGVRGFKRHPDTRGEAGAYSGLLVLVSTGSCGGLKVS